MVHDVVIGAGSSPVTHIVGPISWAAAAICRGVPVRPTIRRSNNSVYCCITSGVSRSGSTVMKSGCTWAASGRASKRRGDLEERRRAAIWTVSDTEMN